MLEGILLRIHLAHVSKYVVNMSAIFPLLILSIALRCHLNEVWARAFGEGTNGDMIDAIFPTNLHYNTTIFRIYNCNEASHIASRHEGNTFPLVAMVHRQNVRVLPNMVVVPDRQMNTKIYGRFEIGSRQWHSKGKLKLAKWR